MAVFVLVAIFYERPVEQEKRRAPYLPPENFVGKAKKGKQLFELNCVKCHGSDMKGTEQGPPLMHPYYRPDHHGDITIYLAVYQGVVQHHWQFGNMPAMKHLSAEEAGHLLVYIRAEQKAAGLF